MTETVHVGAAPTTDADLLRAAIGTNNTSFYEHYVDAAEASGSSTSWNWPAFFVTAYWLLYRKLWGAALLYIFLFPVALALAAALLIAAFSESVGQLVYVGLAVAVSFVLVPMYANALYASKLRRLVQRAQALHADRDAQITWLAHRGGTSWVWIILLMVPLLGGILAAVLLPAYQDYIQNANAAKVQVHYEEAVRFVDNEMRGARAEVALGTRDIQDLELDWDGERWVAELNAAGATSPTGEAAYATSPVDHAGVVGIRARGSLMQSTYEVTITRPRYGLFADEPVERTSLVWPAE